MKDPDAKELVKTVSNNARKRIIIAAKLKHSYKGFSILRAVILYAQSNDGYSKK